MTTTKNISEKNTDSHLNLTAGTHTLDGQQALGLVRTRHGVGDGSDLGRIQLQQAFIKALVNQVKHIGVLSSPTKLYDLADTATKTVTTDSDLGTVKNLASFANGLKGVGSSNMNMVTMPVQYDSADANRVLVDKAKAQLVWTALKNDRAIPKAATKGTATGTTRASSARWLAPVRRPRRGPYEPVHRLGNRSPKPRFWGMAPVLADWYVGSGSRTRIPRWRPGALPKLGDTLKRDIHPEYVETQVSCTCGAWFTTRSTIFQRLHPRRGLLRVPPVLHGQAEVLDTGGRVARFEARFGKAAAAKK